jgi:hypothetical protein
VKNLGHFSHAPANNNFAQTYIIFVKIYARKHRAQFVKSFKLCLHKRIQRNRAAANFRPSRKEVEEAIQGHILAKGKLVGKYHKQDRLG